MSLLEEAVAAGDWAGVAALRRGEEGAALSPLLEGVRDRHRDVLSAVARCDP